MSGYAQIPSVQATKSAPRARVDEQYTALKSMAALYRIAGYILLTFVIVGGLILALSFGAGNSLLSAISLITALFSVFPLAILAISLFAFADLLLAVRSTEYHTRLLAEYAWQFKALAAQSQSTAQANPSAPYQLDGVLQQLGQHQHDQATHIADLTAAVQQLTAQQQAATDTLRTIAENTRAAAWLLNQRRS